MMKSSRRRLSCAAGAAGAGGPGKKNGFFSERVVGGGGRTHMGPAPAVTGLAGRPGGVVLPLPVLRLVAFPAVKASGRLSFIFQGIFKGEKNERGEHQPQGQKGNNLIRT